MRGGPSTDGIPVGPALVAAILVLALGCRPPDAERALAARWAEGPVGWLLLPEDKRALADLRPGEWPAFLEVFWSRRSRLAPRFEARVAAADQLYGEPGVSGSLTDRGGALILLGDPGHLQVGELTVPTPRGRDGTRRTTRLPMEVWIYRPDRLEGALGERLEVDPSGELRLVFVTEGGRTRLVEGSHLLALAARAWVDSGDGGPRPDAEARAAGQDRSYVPHPPPSSGETPP